MDLALLQRLTSKNVGARQKAHEELEKLDPSAKRNLLPGLIGALKDKDARSHAANALVAAGPAAVPFLAGLLAETQENYEDKVAHHMAVLALERIGVPDAREAVLRYRLRESSRKP